MNTREYSIETYKEAVKQSKRMLGIIRKYHNITKDDMLNGDGLRVVLWMSGCEHHCKGCHNPITWDPDDGLEFTEETKEEIYNELWKDYISGITFSGGDPLATYNVIFTRDLILDIKGEFPDKTIWVYTGYTFEELMERSKTDYNITDILSNIDVLVDGKFVESKKDENLLWKGSSNQRVINVKETIKNNSIVLHCNDYERQPDNTTKCRGCN